MLERGAVEGELFHRGAVQALAPEETQITPQAHGARHARGLIRPDRAQLPGEDGFRFRHLLIRDAAYEALPKSTRVELHRALRGVARGARRRSGRARRDPRLPLRAGSRLCGRARSGRRERRPRRPRRGSSTHRRRARGRSRRRGRRRQAARAGVGPDPEGGSGAARGARRVGLRAGRPGRAEASPVDLRQGGRRRIGCRRRGGRVAGARGPRRRRAVAERVGHRRRRRARPEGDSRPRAARATTSGWPVRGFWSGSPSFWQGKSGDEAFARGLACARRARSGRDEAQILNWFLVSSWYGPTPAHEALARCRDVLEQTSSRQVEAIARIEQGALLALSGRFDEARRVLEGRRGDARGAGTSDRLRPGRSQELFDIERLAGDLPAAEAVLREACDVLEEARREGLPLDPGGMSRALPRAPGPSRRGRTVPRAGAADDDRTTTGTRSTSSTWRELPPSCRRAR